MKFLYDLSMCKSNVLIDCSNIILNITVIQTAKKRRQHLRQLIDRIDKLAVQCAYQDGLIQGTPGEVFRTCGRDNCKCASDPVCSELLNLLSLTN